MIVMGITKSWQPTKHRSCRELETPKSRPCATYQLPHLNTHDPRDPLGICYTEPLTVIFFCDASCLPANVVATAAPQSLPFVPAVPHVFNVPTEHHYRRPVRQFGSPKSISVGHFNRFFTGGFRARNRSASLAAKTTARGC